MNLALKVASKIKRVTTEQIAQSPLSGLVADKIKGNHILMYHGVTQDGSTLFNKRNIAYRFFVKHLEFIKKHAAVISLKDFFEEKFVPGKPNFAITFDDGLLNNFIYAKAALEKFQFPATFFVTGLNEINDDILWFDLLNIASVYTDADLTIEGEKFKKSFSIYYSCETGKSIYDIIRYEKADYNYKLKVKEAFRPYLDIQNNSFVREYWRLMTDRHIVETSRAGLITIGCHGYYHNNLASIPHQDAMEELSKGKKYLENLLQQPVNQLAFPDGSYTGKLMDESYNMGFSIQLAGDRYLYNERLNEFRLKRRYGIYTVDSCMNQLFTGLTD